MWGRSTPRGVSASAWQEAISADGPIIVTVHGTGSALASDDGERWWQRGSEFLAQVAKGVKQETGLTPTILPFHWSGDNSDFDRFTAAKQLQLMLVRLRETKMPIALLAHSHGGNVVYYVLRYFSWLFPRYPQFQPIVSYGTPFLERDRKALNTLVLAFHGFTAIFFAALFVSMLAYSIVTIAHFSLGYNNAGKEWWNYWNEAGELAITSLLHKVADPRIVIVPLAAISVALPFCMVVTWNYGLRYVFSQSKFRSNQSRWGQLWLSVRSLFDEPIALLGGVQSFKIDFVSDSSMRRSALAVLTAINIVVCLAVLIGLSVPIFGDAVRGESNCSGLKCSLCVFVCSRVGIWRLWLPLSLERSVGTDCLFARRVAPK